MAINYPTSLDNWTNPTGADTLATTPHSTHHANHYDAIEALEGYLGVAANDGRGGVPPAYHGFLAWSNDPTITDTSMHTLVSGTLYVVGLWAPRDISVTGVNIMTTSSGTATAAYGAIYSQAGALLRQTSSSAHALFGSIGLKTLPLTAIAVPQGKFYAAWWVVTASAPIVYTTSSYAPGTGLAGNMNLSLANTRFASADTGLTSTAPATMGTKAALSRSIWCAVS